MTRPVAAILVAAAAAAAVAVVCVRCTGPRIAPGAKLVVVPVGAPRPSADVPVVFAEVAATPEARERGLGGRDHLAPDSGMLFVYRTAAPHTYWMKDCLIALDIAFIDSDRRIANVATLPACAGKPAEDIVKANSAGPVGFVLETEAGWFAKHGIGAGDKVDLAPALVGVAPR